MQLFYCPNIQDGQFFLNLEESRHCVRVLRKNVGDHIQITDGLGNIYEAELGDLNPKKCGFKLVSSRTTKKPDFSIHVAIAPTKNIDRIEWFVEKATEIGVNEISFIQTLFSERQSIKLDRIRKKAISAMKQSQRAFLPNFHEIIKLNPFISSVADSEKYIAHLEDDTTSHLLDLAKPGKNYVILIGPEGGFSEDEVIMIKNSGYQVVKLGNARLRTETAGVVACSIFNDLNR